MIPIFQLSFPDAPVKRFEHAGHFIQEDVPLNIVGEIEATFI